MRTRYRIYRLLVSLEFTEPANKRQPLAEFDGENQRKERLLETLAQGACRTY